MLKGYFSDLVLHGHKDECLMRNKKKEKDKRNVRIEAAVVEILVLSASQALKTLEPSLPIIKHIHSFLQNPSCLVEMPTYIFQTPTPKLAFCYNVPPCFQAEVTPTMSLYSSFCRSTGVIIQL